MHFQHFHCISSDCILHMLHINASLFILTHSCKLHSGMMHSLAFIRIFNVAFGTKCIHVHFYASYVGCIFIACCIHVHPMHKMHSCAFLVCCILSMSHCNAFWCILSLMHFRMCCIWCTWYIHVHCRMYAFWTWCIKAHLDACTCVALWCILIMMHSCALPYVCILNRVLELWASPLGGLHSPWLRVWVNASECVWMRKNASASECNVRQNAPYVWRHTNAFKCNSCRMQRTVNAQ